MLCTDAAATDEAMNEDQLQLEYQRQKELEAEQQRQLEAQKQKQLEEERQKELEKQRQKKLEAQREKERRQAEAEIQRQREMEQEFDNVTIQQYNGTKQLSQIELEAQRQAEHEARMRREMEDKKKERSGKQKSVHKVTYENLDLTMLLIIVLSKFYEHKNYVISLPCIVWIVGCILHVLSYLIRLFGKQVKRETSSVSSSRS